MLHASLTIRDSSKDNRYLTVFFASRSDGYLNVLEERN
jgi:hypothetical protein